MALLLLTLTTCGLVLHSWFFIEIQFNEVALIGIAFDKKYKIKFDKIFNPMKNTFSTNLNIFIYIILFFFIKHLWMSLISSTSVAS